MRTRRPGRSTSQRILVLAISACAAGLFGFPASLPSAQEPSANTVPELTLEQYREELDRWAGAIQQPSQIRQLQESLPPVWVVRVGEKRLEVPTEPIRSQLQQLHGGNSQGAARALRSLLNGMKEEAAEMGRSEGRLSPAKVQATLAEILRRKEFRSARGPSDMEMLTARISRWLVENLAGLLSKLPLGARTGNIMVWSFIVLAFLALCYMAWKWIIGWQPAEAAKPAAPSAPSDARQWVQEALAAAEHGDYRAALHCAYWAVVARLEDLGRLSRDRARTPRESLRLLESQPGDHGVLHALTAIFERVWYGYRAASEADWAGAKELLEKIGCLGVSTAPTANS
ncbi:MAG TPA: DUF4129 domain-containing protein [Candidatus Acidoferrum sp.]|jgi:hypothetical protein|nr:DUF4129 domain-containing protein [Candidatus Acidoferrum sp.]